MNRAVALTVRKILAVERGAAEFGGRGEDGGVPVGDLVAARRVKAWRTRPGDGWRQG